MKKYFLSAKFLGIGIAIMLIAQSAISQSKPIVVATYRYADNDRIANIKPLAEHLGQQLNHPVDVRSYPTVHAFITALQNDEVDVALINTFGYLLLDAGEKNHKMIPAAVMQPKVGTQDNYKTAIVARKGVGVESLEVLQKMANKLRWALVAPGSTSGNLVPRLALSRRGLTDLEKAFKQVSYSGTHRAAMDSLLANKADVAAMGSTEYVRLRGDSDRITLLWLSPEIPLGPVLLHQRLGNSVREQVATALLSLHTQNSVAFNAVKQGWSEAKEAEKFVRYTKDYYTPFLNQIGTKSAIKTILSQFAN